MNEEKEVLEPCPRCGKSDIHLIYRIYSEEDHTFGYQGECAPCGHKSPWRVLRSFATETWNEEARQ